VNEKPKLDVITTERRKARGEPPEGRAPTRLEDIGAKAAQSCDKAAAAADELLALLAAG
jgi:hypothetical protein